MSFGFGAGDFVTALQLAKAAYSACRDGPGEYQEIAREAKTLRYALTQLSKDCDDPSSLINRKGTTGRRKEFRNMITNCEAVFVDLQQFVDKHSVLEPGTEHGSPVRRLWHAYQVGSEDLESLRGQLTFHTSVIAMFQNSLSGSAISRIEAKLDKLCERMIVEDNAETGPSTISLASTTSFLSQLESDEQTAWKVLRDELQSNDISMAAVMANKDEILLYMKNLLSAELEPVQLLPEAIDLSGSNSGSRYRLFGVKRPVLKQLIPLGPPKVNYGCLLDEVVCWEKALRSGYLNGRWSRSIETRNFAVQVAGVSVTRNIPRVRANTLNEVLRDSSDTQLIWELLEGFLGLQVSLCTGLASSVPLRRLIADVTSNLVAEGSDVAIRGEYKRFIEDPAFLQALQEGNLPVWAQGADNPDEMKELVTAFVLDVLGVLQYTGVKKV